MELANWAEWARVGAALAAVALLVGWLRMIVFPIMTIAEIGFYRGDVKGLKPFVERIAAKGRNPELFLVDNESEILRSLVELNDCIDLLNELIDSGYIAAYRALSIAVRRGRSKIVMAVVNRFGIPPGHIERAISVCSSNDVKAILIARWEDITGKKWKNGPDWPPSRDEGYGPSAPAPGHGGSPGPIR